MKNGRVPLRSRFAGAAVLGGFAILMMGPGASLALESGALTRAAQESPVSATVQGTNPHGQGTVLSASIGGNEAIVVGRSRGEQGSDGQYKGGVTTLALFGNDVIANQTGPGETAKGPLAPLQEGLLDQICTGSSGNICVDVLRADSQTTANGSKNHHRLAGVQLGGDNGIKAQAADSNGNIERDGDCQRAHGDVTLVQLMVGGNNLLNIGRSASDSNACPGGTTVTNSANPLVELGGEGIPLPGCGANEPGNLIDLSPLLVIACNAGSQAGVGGIANSALSGAGLIADGEANLGLTGAGTSGSATVPAQAPAQGVLGERQASPDDDDDGRRDDDDDDGAGTGTADDGVPASAKTPRALDADEADKLPYTGTNVVLSLFIACCLLAAGLGMRRLDLSTHTR